MDIPSSWVLPIIPVLTTQNPLAHLRHPMDVMRSGSSMSLFQASQHRATLSSQDVNTRFESQLSRMNCQTFSTGFSSGECGGRGSKVVLSGIWSFGDVCHPA